MPPPKKAVKKAVKKSAKKAAGHHHDKHHQAKDLRRAYEHMGRLQVLESALTSSAADAVGVLARLAQHAVEGGNHKGAADLLRASEHLSFAALADKRPDTVRLAAELESSIEEQYVDLSRRADDHWEDNGQQSVLVTAIYERARNSAAKAFKNGAYHRALEFARAAEALAHVDQQDFEKLVTGKKSLKFKAA